MSLNLTNNIDIIKTTWDRLSKIPVVGKKLFSKSIGWIAPYTGTAGIQIDELRSGYGRGFLKQRRKISNHLSSIHAIALANFAEAISGVSLMYSLPAKSKGILVKFEISYLKKARGTLTAICEFIPPSSNTKQDFKVTVNILNSKEEVVCTADFYWKIAPVESKA